MKLDILTKIMEKQEKMEKKLNKVLSYLKPKLVPVLNSPSDGPVDSKFVTVSLI